MGQAESSNVVVNRRPLRALILEDDPADAELMVAALDRDGYAVTFDRVAAVEVFQARLEDAYDIILADFDLRTWTALDALEILSKSARNTPLVLVTGSLGEEAAVECLRRGAADYVLKDRPTRLAGAVRRALELKALREDRARAEKALKESEERFRLLAENAQDTIYRLRLLPVRQYEYVSPAVKAMTGYTPEEHYADPDLGLRIVHPDERHRMEQYWRGEGNCSPTLVLRWVRKDGAVIWTEQRNASIYDSKGRMVAIEGIVRDITEYRLAEEALRKSEARLSHAQSIAHIGSWEHDVVANASYWSDEVSRIFGLAPGEFDGTLEAFLGHVHPEDRKRVERAIQLALEGGQSFSLDHRLARSDGSVRVVHEEAEVLSHSNGRPLRIVGTIHDITERVALEEKFRQAQKMEAVGRLAGGIAHDFNNLLTIINGRAELLLERTDTNNEARPQLEEIRRAGERAASLTRQLLAFSRRQIMAPQVLDLNGVVANVERMLRRLIGEDIHLATIPAEGVTLVKADPSQLEQVILNLAVNARDAMPQGGRLTIETANVELDEGHTAAHPPMRPGNYVMLAVSDTGCGMDATTQSHIFEPFFTTKEPGKGTGLGLATVYGIVKQSGGFVWAYSEVGQGTTFKIYLPQAAGTSAAVSESKPVAAPTGGSETILIAEDEPGVRALVRLVLTSRGYTVLEARNGEDAILQHEMHKGSLHLLLTDVIMPDMSGRELAERLAPFHREMAVLYMSGYTDDAIARHGILEAGTAFIQKPFTPEALARKVREVLDARKHPRGAP